MSETVTKLLVQEVTFEDVQIEWWVEPHHSLHIVITYPNIESIFKKLYWRLDDPAGENLLNFDINGHSGLIEMIEVIAYNGSLENINYDNIIDAVDFQYGIPRIEINSWEKQISESNNNKKITDPIAQILPFPKAEKFIDFPGKFQLQVSEEQLRIELFDEPIFEKIVLSEELTLELNQFNEICGITLAGFVGQSRDLLVEKYNNSNRSSSYIL